MEAMKNLRGSVFPLANPGDVGMSGTSRCNRVLEFPYPAGFFGRFEGYACGPQTRKNGFSSLIVRVAQSWC